MPRIRYGEVKYGVYQIEGAQSDEGSALRHSELGLPGVRREDGRPWYRVQMPRLNAGWTGVRFGSELFGLDADRKGTITS